ncbi:MAG: magnesium/cobalt transporter CorA [Flavobacteriales bacterium]|nr:magnesium/cobalt transporter CorA [Flavobacteriales bacterium]
MAKRRRNFKRNSLKAGLPPGALVLIGNQREEPVTIELIDYSEDSYAEVEIADVEDLKESLLTSTVSWVNINGIHNTDAIGAIGKVYGIHNLVLEDILNTDHRPKVEPFEDYVFFTMKMMWYNKNDELEHEQISIVFGKPYVLCFQEVKGDIFDPIRQRIRENSGLIRKKGTDYLVYRLIDSVVDNYFAIIERIDERVENLEIAIIEETEEDLTREIQHLKREIITLKRALLPLREAVSGLEKRVSELIDPDNEKYFRDVYDHLIQIADNLETNREVLSGLMDLQMANMSNRMNQVMKVLTVIASLFIPLTFIAGIYGMNFEYMPELHWKYGYFAVWGLMLLIFAAMLIFFRRKKWF